MILHDFTALWCLRGAATSVGNATGGDCNVKPTGTTMIAGGSGCGTTSGATTAGAGVITTGRSQEVIPASFAALVVNRIRQAASICPIKPKARAASLLSHSLSSLLPPREIPPIGADMPAEPDTRQGAEGNASGAYAAGAWRT